MVTASISARITTLAICLLCMYGPVSAQEYLDRPITMTATRQPLRDVLQAVARQGGFYFSYNSNIIPEDSLVSFSMEQQTVRYLLGSLLKDHYQYKTAGDYVIIQYASSPNVYTISGYIADALTGQGVSDASVYERKQLAVTFTDKQGFFRLKLKDRFAGVAVNISKMDYADTAIYIMPGQDQELQVSLQPAPVALNGVTIPGRTSRSWLSDLLLSARQKKQRMNLRDFFTDKPYQFSLVPGLSTRGKLNPQVINRFSLNVVGGYTAGSKGFELGGLFNINQQVTRSLQLAGGLNVTEGSASGVQVAGLHNLVMDTLKGIQLSAFTNKVEGVAAGVQIAGVYNYAKHLKGLQIGAINRTDSSGGWSLGVLNFVRGGYRRVAFTANDLMSANVSFITGNKNLYSIIIVGANLNPDKKLFSFGGGLGHDFLLGRSAAFSLQANYQFLKLRSIDNRMIQAKGLASIALSKHIRLSAGPTYQWYTNNDEPQDGYKHIVSVEEYEAASFFRKVRKNWIGWEAGLVFETSRPAREIKNSRTKGWRLGLGLEGGPAFDYPPGWSAGATLQLQKDFASNISALVTAGWTRIWLNERHFSRFSTDPIYTYDLIPLKAGLKVFAAKHIYFAALAGISWEVKSEPTSAFVWSPAIGLAWPSGFDVSFKLDYFHRPAAAKLLGLAVAYQFKL